MAKLFDRFSQPDEAWMFLADLVSGEKPLENATLYDHVTPFDLEDAFNEGSNEQICIGENFVTDLLSEISQGSTDTSLDKGTSVLDESHDLSDLISCSDTSESTNNTFISQQGQDDGYVSFESLTSSINEELSHDDLNSLLDSIADSLPNDFPLPTSVLDGACFNLSKCSSFSDAAFPVGNYNHSPETISYKNSRSLERLPLSGIDNRSNVTNPVSTIPAFSQPSLHSEQQQKPDISYIELVAKALMNAPTPGMLLTDIYQWIEDSFPYYKENKSSWRNSIRHNLSVNECFVKGKRARNGRGFFWSIHSSCLDAFKNGDFDRRKARRQVQECNRAFGTALEELNMLKQLRSHPSSSRPLSQPVTNDPNSYNSFTMGGMNEQNMPLNSTPLRQQHLSSVQPTTSYTAYQYRNNPGYNTSYYF